MIVIQRSRPPRCELVVFPFTVTVTAADFWAQALSVPILDIS
jgi:hypothetical protein